MTNNISYTFTVQASNSNGAGPASEHSNSVTPLALAVPSEPGNVVASGATSQALVSWSAPTSEGGSAITGYTITPYIGSSAQSATQVSGNAMSTIVKGLTNGTTYTFLVTATNSVGEGPPSASSNAAMPENTIFDFATPATIDSGDPGSVEIGVKFTSELYGSVTGIRFYKAATNTGTHVGSLWTAGGKLLASATFTNENASGWQEVNFSTPVTINPNTTYVAAYLAPKGHYSITSAAFASLGASNPPLHALANTLSSNGVYTYTTSGAFPSSTFNASNYWVDAAFVPYQVPGQVTNVGATSGLSSATVTWSAPSSGGPVTAYTITHTSARKRNRRPPSLGRRQPLVRRSRGSPPAPTTHLRSRHPTLTVLGWFRRNPAPPLPRRRSLTSVPPPRLTLATHSLPS